MCGAGITPNAALDAEDESARALAQIDEAAADDDGEATRAEEFAARRLSVHNPYDEDWNSPEDEEGEGEASTTQPSAAVGSTQRA